jgi:hypothetical protein
MKRACLLIVLLLTSCTPIGKQPSILDDSNCDAPCWNEIKVGTTTKAETLDILSELPIVVPGSIAEISYAGPVYDDRANFFIYPDPIFKDLHGAYGQAEFLGDKVVDIGFCGSLGVTFGDITRRIAEPKSIIIGPSPSGGLFVIAVNEDAGLQFWYDTQNIPKYLRTEIAPEIQVDCLHYFEPELYQEMLEAGLFSMGHLDAEMTLRAMHPWVGYGDLNMYRQ